VVTILLEVKYKQQAEELQESLQLFGLQEMISNKVLLSLAEDFPTSFLLFM